MVASKKGVPVEVGYGTSARFLYQNSKYKVGISKRFGAAITEYYNKRVDSTMNLVTSDNGAALQTALFGAKDVPNSGGSDCQGGRRLRWNPTQAGSHCRAADGGRAGSVIDSCTSSSNLCNRDSFTESVGSGEWIQWRVSYRNFFYEKNPHGVYKYKPFDDVRALIRYTFHADHVQADYQIWRTRDTNYGAYFQALPTGFFTQMTRYTYSPSGTPKTTTRSESPTDDAQSVANYSVGPSTGRWVTAESVNRPGSPPVMTPGNHLTAAYYNSIPGCPARKFLISFFGDNYQQSSHAKNYLKSYAPTKGTYMNVRGLIFPYRYNETLPGKTAQLGKLIDTPGDGSGSQGYMPVNELFL
ncbi:hypothetical protein [Streptomyces halobius]|uniref:Uncharacterized protein n=1 Tax=Streptomyces halobius TaxID=2879846 RepID=A0ABY4MCQ6_9ACTN|nr:hypothetical protein [Streptomyces halobius]UQA94559.1 hypothetical protein K9S39_24270 [Streptomyces halobius]